jgi:hypothetical protein
MQTWQEFLSWEQSSRQTIDFKTIYVDITGDLIAGLMLSQIVYWHLPNKRGESRLSVVHDNKAWLARSDSEWFDEIRITKEQARRARQILTEKMLIETHVYKFNGVPTTHIRINQNALMLLLKKQSQTNLGQDTNGNVLEHKSTCATAQMEMGCSTNGNVLEHKSLTETTTEITSETTTEIDHAPSASALELFDYTDQDYEQDQKAKYWLNGEPQTEYLAAAACGNVEKRKLPRGGHDPEGFAKFWQQYPRKTAKANAQSAWNRLKANAELQATILHDLAQRKQVDHQWRDVAFVPHPATYLNGKRWEDEIVKPSSPPTALKHASAKQTDNEAVEELWAMMRGEIA